MLPSRYQDILPEPLPLLPPEEAIFIEQDHSILETTDSGSVYSSTSSPRLFSTPRNQFGLRRQYYSTSLPSHDPEEMIQLADLSEDGPDAVQQDTSITKGKNPFAPYPNESSFVLGDWYWNAGIQKSRDNFKELVGIISDPRFCTDDIRDTKWSSIDKILAVNDFDGVDPGDEAWMDVDASWRTTRINISVPFHSKNKSPGPKNFFVGNLYHRSLVSVIREKLANPLDNQQFHYDPFKLTWRPNNTAADKRVYGELYTSPAFLDAHRKLQESPPEPGCTLPRFVVAMMLWSDATHLTSFGDAKLWPCYLSFGNESKYRRCKPSCHLNNHVAYFQSVSGSIFRLNLKFICQYSYPTHSKILPVNIQVLSSLATIS